MSAILSQYTGRELHVDPPRGRLLDDEEGMECWSREYAAYWTLTA